VSLSEKKKKKES